MMIKPDAGKYEQGKQHPQNQQGVFGSIYWAKGYARRYLMPNAEYEKGIELHFIDTDLGSHGVVAWLLGWKCASEELSVAMGVMP